eukprot:Pgem_evm1s1985
MSIELNNAVNMGNQMDVEGATQPAVITPTDEETPAPVQTSTVISSDESSSAFLETNLKMLLGDIDEQIAANQNQLLETTKASTRIGINRYLLELKEKRLKLVADFVNKKSESKSSAMTTPIKKKIKIISGGVKTLADKCLLMYYAKKYVERHCSQDCQHKAVLLEHFETNKCYDDAQCIMGVEADLTNIDQLINM